MLWNMENLHKNKGETMIKKIIKWVMLIPVKIVEWAMWPIAQIHIQLTHLSKWLKDKLS